MNAEQEKAARESFDVHWKTLHSLLYYGVTENTACELFTSGWHACLAANGVGEPSDVEGLRQACKKARDLLLVMGRLRFNSRNVDPVIEELNAALAKREDGVPQTVLTANAKPLFEFDERSFVDLEELKRRGFVCRIATVAVSNPETGEEKILMLPLGEE